MNIRPQPVKGDFFIKWDDFNFRGTNHSLLHLDSFIHIFEQEAKGDKLSKRYSFIIEFGLHCFTKGPSKHKGKVLSDYPEELYYKDSRETRIFCFRRHLLSSRLPGIAKNISQTPCYHTGKGNFFVIDIENDNGDSDEFEVYFRVSRSGGGRLRLFIESAYVRDDEHGSSQPKKKKINFFVIANNIQNNKPIRAQK